MENVARLELARNLVHHLETGDEDGATQIIDEMARERENSLFMEVGRLTRELHDALRNVQMDSRLEGLAEHEIPDAKQRLRYVIEKTEQAANRTLNAVEDLLPLSEKMGSTAATITDDWTRFTRRQMDLTEFRNLSDRLTGFLLEVREDSTRLQSGLSDVLMAQDFQDLTGQVIRRVIDLVSEVENNLVRLVRCAGRMQPDPAAPRPLQGDALRGEGPQVEGTRQCGETVNGQDDVDELLSSLGF